MDAERRAAMAAELLAAAWRDGGRVSLPDDLVPHDLEAATAIQDKLSKHLDLECVGWKLALTSAAGQAREGFERPFTGRLFRGFVRRSPAEYAPGSFRQPLLEAEIAFRMARGLPSTGRTFEETEVLDAVDSAFVGIEVADVRYAARWPFAMPLLAADNGAAGGFVVGPDIPDWRERDLSLIEGSMEINGKHAAGNLAGNERTNAIAALAWAANELAHRGYGLRPGDLVTTGSATVPTRCDAGTTAVARFAGIGEVRVTI
jgi:2-keto-4-pentenoate hydratase